MISLHLSEARNIIQTKIASAGNIKDVLSLAAVINN